jgi:type IV pilus assembly protein PilM
MFPQLQKYLEKYFDTIRRFLPSEEKVAAVGLDIGTSECALVEITRANGAFELVNCAIEPIQGGNTKAAVEKILGKLTVPTKSVYTSVFGKGTLIRYIDVPKMSLDELRSSFEIESDKYFPFPPEEVYTDCCILNVNEKTKKMSVMAAAAKKDVVDQRMKLLTDLGVSADFVGVNAIALANAFAVLGSTEEKQGASAEPAVALLDMGGSVDSLTIFVDGQPRFTRDIFIGGEDFTKSISQALGISLAEAEKLKNSPGKRQEEILNACDGVISNMVQELRLSMDYFTTEHNCEVHRLFLTGGAAMLTGIEEIFKKNLEVNVSQWSPLPGLKTGEGISAGDLEKKASKLGVVLGLALYHYD